MKEEGIVIWATRKYYNVNGKGVKQACLGSVPRLGEARPCRAKTKGRPTIAASAM